MIRHLLLFILISLISRTESDFFTTQCPSFCTCDITDRILTISCSQYNSMFKLPYYEPVLTSTESIIAKFNYLKTLPESLCLFKSTLRILDISSNEISENISANSLNCLIKLEFLNMSRNAIKSIDTNAFILLGSLLVLDLSYNKLSFLPSNLFTDYRTKNLKYLFLNNNLLTDIDVWFFYLSSIIKIDLSYNYISKFTNRIGYTPSSKTSNQLPNATLIDLRNNALTKFDDSILVAYHLCTATDLGYFFHLINVMRIDSNFFDCSCSSYRLLMFYQTLKSASSITNTNNIFQAKCSTPLEYAGKSIFEFGDPSDSNFCKGVSPIVDNCTTTTTTIGPTTTVSIQNPELLINILRNQTYETYDLGDGQIAGIAVGFFGACVLLLVLFYCLCPIEILACTFGLCPSFYRICPCKSGVLSSKYYDIFISYNKSSEDWVQNKLVPFLDSRRPNDRYFLQYDKTNVYKEKFGSFTRGKMDNSAVLLLVLSDKYLMKEWQVPEFRSHVRHLLTRIPRDESDRTRLVCVQMHDVCDEEVDDYVRHQLQIPRFVSLETDEFYFWNKLNYYLHSNKEKDPVIVPVNITEQIITVTSDESPRSEESVDQTFRGNYLLDEYSTSLEQIIYEKIPTLNVKNEIIHDMQYDCANKKFIYTTQEEFEARNKNLDQEERKEEEEEEQIEEKPKRKHKKHHRHKSRKSHNNSSNVASDESAIVNNSYEGISSSKSVTFKTSSNAKIYF